MSEGQLGRALIEQNPWWVFEDWARDDPDLRGLAANVPFEYRPLPLAGIAPDGLYLLLGPRRVGKSVELKRAVVELVASGVEPRRIVYFSCDALRATDLPKLFRAARNLTRIPNAPRYWLLDEITSVAGWAAVIKGERDQTRLRDDCVVLTGSSSRDLQDAVAELAGRHGRETADAERLLLPMPFRAFCRAIGVEGLPDIPPVRPRDVFMSRRIVEDGQLYWPRLADAWQSFLRVGGYPRAVEGFVTGGRVPLAFIQDLWDVIRGEAFRTISMTAPETLALLNRLAVSLAGTINASDMARDLDLRDNARVEARITALVSAFLGVRCYQDDDGRANVNAQRKFYFTDPLLARLAHLRDRGYADPDDSRVTEQQVGLALHRAIEREQPGSFVQASEVRYWVNRTTRAEIDFVGRLVGAGCEVKYVDEGWRGAARTLLAHGPGGVVVTRSAFALDGDAVAIPAGLYVWLIGG